MSTMITLSELRSRVKNAPLSTEEEAPGWRTLRNSGGGIVETALLSDDSFVEVYYEGYVYYRTGKRWTTFSLTDTMMKIDYEFTGERTELDTDYPYYAQLPWIIRVVLCAEYRIESNLIKDRTVRNAAPIDSTFDDYGTFGYDCDDPLEILLKQELSRMLYKSYCMITERQQQVIRACIIDNKRNKDVAEELEITHQAVSDALAKGLRAFREAFIMNYGKY